MVKDDERTLPLRSAEMRIPARSGDDVSDAVLLERFIEQWDQAAFRDLVYRHGPMVLGVCHRILRDRHAAEDAFQATFLLLVRKAGSVRKRESVGPWLYGVAQRVALESRAMTSRRRLSVGLDREISEMEQHDGLERDELHRALHEELGRLPEKYRAPLLLCYVEGLTHQAAAQQLGWPIGTVRVRIARGRDALGERLVRRGLAPALVLLAWSLLSETAVAVPLRLVDATVEAAACAVAGERAPKGEIPARVVALEMKVRKAMRWTRLKWTAALVLGGIAVAAGLVVVVPNALAEAAEDRAKAAAELKKLQGTWVIVAAEEEGAKKKVPDDAEQLRFRGDTFITLHGGKVEQEGTIKLDPTKNPMEIDFHVEKDQRNVRIDRAIYAWDGENLRVCMGKDRQTRPKDFVGDPGSKQMAVIMNRKSP